MSAVNAPYVLPRAAGMALLARDAAHARLARERMVATGAHGRAIDMDLAAVRAGLAALDGSTQEAIAGFRAAIAGWRDLGLPWDEAMTSLIFPVSSRRPRDVRRSRSCSTIAACPISAVARAIPTPRISSRSATRRTSA